MIILFNNLGKGLKNLSLSDVNKLELYINYMNKNRYKINKLA